MGLSKWNITRRVRGSQKQRAPRTTFASPALGVIGPGLLHFGWVSAKALASGLVVKPLGLMMAKAGNVAVGVGCQHHPPLGYSWSAPVAGPSSSNGNRVGAVCALVPFAIRLVGAGCQGDVGYQGRPWW
ncbi:MAG: hypothetical protein AWU57_4849 [Marinobacter sp. T13-3]|nr:MAG: hypothetical protein AWU57_4849 [Marinobacter sp. T13-3]